MSFSSDTKKEISSLGFDAKHCQIAEIAGFINSTVAKSSEDPFCVLTENPAVARRFYSLIKSLFKYEIEIKNYKNKKLNNKRIYKLEIADCKVNERIAKACAAKKRENQGKTHINPLIVQKSCCKRAFLRGAFLAIGSVSNPEKAYHLEFVCSSKEYAAELARLLDFYNLNAKIIKRKNSFVIYLKESEKIVLLLNVISAHKALLKFENVRILKSVINDVNRSLNFEIANFNKTIHASIKQVDDINFIQKKVGLSFLNEGLQDLANLRLAYPEASLKELGEKLDPAISKSGINHRLRKIGYIAESLKNKEDSE